MTTPTNRTVSIGPYMITCDTLSHFLKEIQPPIPVDFDANDFTSGMLMTLRMQGFSSSDDTFDQLHHVVVQAKQDYIKFFNPILEDLARKGIMYRGRGGKPLQRYQIVPRTAAEAAQQRRATKFRDRNH